MPSIHPENDRLSTVLRIAQLGFWEMRMDNRCFSLSPDACAIFGLPPEQDEHPLDTFLCLMHPADRERVSSAIARALRGDAPLDIEHRIVRPSGEERHVQARGELVELDGRPCYLGTVQDITERIERQDEAEQNARLLQTASRLAHLGGWSYEVETGRVTWSDEVCRIHEVPLGAAPTAAEALAFFTPECRPRIESLVDDCIRAGVPYDEELLINTAKGRRLWVRATGEPVRDANNAIVRLQGAFQDISERRLAEEKTQRLARRLTATFESITDAFFTLDRGWHFTYLNRPAERLLQRSRADLLGKVIWDEFRPLKAQLGYCEFQRALRENCSVAFEDFYARTLFEVRAYPSEEGLAVYVRDVTDARRIEESLRVSEERFRTIARSTTDAVWDWDIENDMLWASDSTEQLFGYKPQDLSGPLTAWTDRVHPDDRDRVMSQFHAALHGRDEQWIDEYRFISKDGNPVWVLDRGFIIRDRAGKAIRMIGAMVDLTERRQAERRIEYLAYYDGLTQLPNRQLLTERLQRALGAIAQRGCTDALMFVDMDNFKTLNDSLGHAVGDQMLQQVAQRLTGCVSHNDTVSRFGGDEFVILVEHLSGDESAARNDVRAIGERILHALKQPYALGEYRHLSTASIGITMFADDQDDVGDLLKRADMAMYQAKAAGRNTLSFFNPQMEEVLSARIALEGDLRHALRQCEREFEVHYQPQIGRDGHITGVEALVRWRHPKRGWVSPAEFIPLAEETGLVLGLGEWVLKKACKQLSAWAERRETAGLEIAVNVSARQFHDPGFVAQVLGVLRPAGADPRRLKLELTETSLLKNVEDTIAKMNLLRREGVSFALDDFGTGYSSLAYLKQLPLDMIKIDRSFVLDMLTNPNDAVIARTIIALGRSLGLRVLAEGVETMAQRDFLFEHGCEAYQGYLCAKPLPPAAVGALMARA